MVRKYRNAREKYPISRLKFLREKLICHLKYFFTKEMSEKIRKSTFQVKISI